ncbi:MAG: hypothetical protein R2874_15410 [Desulfobacterales bacterium]
MSRNTPRPILTDIPPGAARRDLLSTIARRYHTTIDTIARHSQYLPEKLYRCRQILKIPHSGKAGDTPGT